jgi:L-alanine-DL-glutamate epimerase-like enolase superfamily enzyme
VGKHPGDHLQRAHRDVRRHKPDRVAYTPGGFTNCVPWIINRATDYLRGDVAVKGGITALIKTAHLAEGFDMNFEVHHGGNSLNNVANLHVIMAIKNCEHFEVLLPAEAQKYGLVQDIEVDGSGLVHAPTAPGAPAIRSISS